MNKNARIYVAGHRGMVGSALVRRLEQAGYRNLLLWTSRELDLRRQSTVDAFFQAQCPEYVFLAAARVGGIGANSVYRAEFLYDNLVIAANVIRAAHQAGVKKLLFLGSSCIYPKLAPQPLKEEYLLTGPLEPTNEPYAIAKIAGLKLCEAYRAQYGDHFITVMPTNLYGMHDNFSRENGHVLPALLHRFYCAVRDGEPSVTVWGTGEPRREFLCADDLADACCFLMERYDEPGIVNIGTGEDITIRELVELVRSVTGYAGQVVYDTAKADGTPVKRLDVSRMKALGWEASVPLERGIVDTYRWFVEHYDTVRK